MRYFILFILFSLTITCTSTKTNNDNYIKHINLQYEINDLVIEIEESLKNSPEYVQNFIFLIFDNYEHSNVPISLVIAQSALETGYGKYAHNNNYFGIKNFKTGVKLKTLEVVNGVSGYYYEPFDSYDSLSESIEKHSTILNDRYNIKKNDQVLDSIKKLSKYATDECYKSKLIRIIKKYNLDKFDKLVYLEEELLTINNQV